MRSSWKRFSLCILFFCALPLAVAQTDLCGDIPPVANPCSFTALNRDCTLTIDRLRPVAPPMIYARHGRKITVTVFHNSPFEDLTLDLGSATATVPTDPFPGIVTALMPGLSKWEEISKSTPLTMFKTPRVYLLTNDSPEKIRADQEALLTEMQSQDRMNKLKSALPLIKEALNAPEVGVCYWNKNRPNLWVEPKAWIKTVDDDLNTVMNINLPNDKHTCNTTPDGSKTTCDLQSVTDYIQELASRIISLNPPASAKDLKTMNDGQKNLTDALDGLKQVKKMETAIDNQFKPNPPKLEIDDLDPKGKNDVNEQWTLSYVNNLTPAVTAAVKNPKADTPAAAATTTVTTTTISTATPATATTTTPSVPPTTTATTFPGTTITTTTTTTPPVAPAPSSTDLVSSGFAALTAAPPAKSAIVKLTVLYQTPPRIETSAGLMLPMLPYHSYASAAAATGGTITGYVVQESKTYTVVPAALVNFVVKDWVMNQQRAALFGTVAVGYNPATSNVEFGVGPSFSWRSIVLSGLLDIGRDTKLAGGFTVGESLGATSVTLPTSTVWRMKPAVGISVRLPLGGSSGK